MFQEVLRAVERGFTGLRGFSFFFLQRRVGDRVLGFGRFFSFGGF